MSTIGSNAVSGLISSQQRVERAASRIATADTPEGKDVSLDKELVDTAIATNDFKANAAVLTVDKQVNKTLLDILA